MLWGKIKHKTIVEIFGDLDQLVSSLPLVPTSAPTPEIRNELGRPDIDPLIHGEAGLPPINFDPLLVMLPAIAARTWTPAGHVVRGHEVSYLALADVDVTEPLDLVERLCDKLSRV